MRRWVWGGGGVGVRMRRFRRHLTEARGERGSLLGGGELPIVRRHYGERLNSGRGEEGQGEIGFRGLRFWAIIAEGRRR